MEIRNFRDFIDSLDGKYDDRVALQQVERDKSISQWKYSQLISDIKSVGQYFIENGYVGKHIGICLENCYDYLVYLYAGYYVGCTVVLLHYDFPMDRLLLNIDRADVELLITNKEIETNVAVYDTKNGLPKAKEIHELPEISPNACACIIFTSGTSGLEKMVMLSQTNLIFSLNYVNTIDSDFVSASYIVFPFSHVSNISMAVMFYIGSVVTFMTKAKYFFKDIKIVKPNSLIVVPMFLEAIYKKVAKGTALSEIIGENCNYVNAGAAVTKQEWIDMFKSHRIGFGNGYGMTETAGVGSLSISGKQEKPGSVGKPTTMLSVEDGEIIIKGPSVMLGYYKDEEATKKAIVDGWMHTGDLGYIDEDGYVFITGRMSNIIKLSNGKKVSPEEVEKKLGDCDKIEEVLVKGEDDKLVAVIYAEEADKDEINEFVKNYNGEVESYKRIHRVEFTNTELPKTVTGKIKRQPVVVES